MDPALRCVSLAVLPLLLCGAHACQRDFDPPLAAPDAIPQVGQTFQRSGGSGAIPISVPAAGELGLAVVRVDRGRWTLLDADLSDGRAEGVVTSVPVGRHAVEVRTGGNTLLWFATDVGVGDVYVLWGQSNMIMRGETRSQSQTGARVLPILLEEGAPTFFPLAIDSLWYPESHPRAAGSAWPLVADSITRSTGIPIGFVAAAEGSTRIAVDPHWNVGGDLWNRMISNVGVATGGTGRVRAVLGHQGESDAKWEAGYSRYAEALCAFGASLAATLDLDAFVVAQIGAFPGIDEAELQAVRDAQRDAAAACEPIEPGPVTVDLPIDATGHFGDAAIPALAQRWCEALAPLYAEIAPLACE